MQIHVQSHVFAMIFTVYLTAFYVIKSINLL